MWVSVFQLGHDRQIRPISVIRKRSKDKKELAKQMNNIDQKRNEC